MTNTPILTTRALRVLGLSLIVSAALQGCGGGGGDSPQATATPSAVPAGVVFPAADMAPVYVIGSIEAEAPAGMELPNATATGTPRYLTPALMQTAYGLNRIYSATNTATQGAGQTIAIIDAYHNPGITNDLTKFSTLYNLPACGTGCFSVVYTKNGVKTTTAPATNAGWAVESSLDVEWAHAVAPLAKIVLVEAASASYNDLLGAAYYAANTLGASVVSMSFGGGEWSTQASATQSYFKSLKSSFIAASGDSGHAVSYPSSSAYVLAVGGSTLSVDASGNYGGESAWTGSGGGISAYESTQPAYWPTVTPLAMTNAWKAAVKPAGRPVPDVAWDADPTSGFYVVSETGIGKGLVGIVGGTSAGAPQWAGLVAIANALRAKAGKAVFNTAQGVTGNTTALNTALAKLSAQSTGTVSYATLYNDVTTGNNGSCGLLCNAAAGWDLATGIGTPRADTLIPALVAY